MVLFPPWSNMSKASAIAVAVQVDVDVDNVVVCALTPTVVETFGCVDDDATVVVVV